MNDIKQIYLALAIVVAFLLGTYYGGVIRPDNNNLCEDSIRACRVGLERAEAKLSMVEDWLSAVRPGGIGPSTDKNKK